MAVSLKHTTVAVGTDAGNGEIAKSQWNEEHTLTLATGKLLGRTTAGTGAVEEISAGTGLTLSAGSLAVSANTYAAASHTHTLSEITDAGTAAASNATDFAPASAAISAIGYSIDGGGAAITTGIAGMGLVIPYACTLNDWTLLADTSGAIKIDVWKDSYANFPPTNADSITNGHEPEIAASGVKAQNTNLSNWTSTSVSAGDILYFNVDSCASITKALLVFKVTKT